MKTLLLLLLLANQVAPAPQRSTAGDYVVGAEDVLAITVIGEADLTNKYVVAIDGAFDFPWIGRIAAKGKTLRQLEGEITARLEDGGFKPKGTAEVTVQVQEYRSQKVYLNGEVAKPGQYPLTGTTSLSDLFAAAGNMLPTAGEEVLIYRRTKPMTDDDGPVLDASKEADVKVITITKNDVFSGRAATQVSLQNGDTIHVAKGLQIYVSGQVKTPGRYTMEGKMTVLQAITLAGGPTERGATNRTEVVLRDGKQVKIKVKLSDFLKPGDHINVPAKWF